MRVEADLGVRGIGPGEADIDLFVQYDWKKANWGRRVTRRTFSETRIWLVGAEEQAWIIDPELRVARGGGESAGEVSLAPGSGGEEALISALTGRPASSATVASAAHHLRDLFSGRNTISGTGGLYAPGVRLFTRTDNVDGGRAWFWPWLWVGAAVFSVVLLPATVLVVRFTMYPPALEEAARGGVP